MNKKKINLSIITTIYNEEENIPFFINEVEKVLIKLNTVNFNFILVDNGSLDNSLNVIKKLALKNKKIKFISLARNFGHQGGLLAGMAFSNSDMTITMDCDLQHPPNMIPKMIELWMNGYKVISAVKNAEFGLFFILKGFFYKILTKLSNLKFLYGQSDFRLIDKIVLQQINQIKDQKIFIRGFVEWLGFKNIKINYNVNKRLYGKTKFSLSNYFSFAVDGILNHSYIPIRAFTLTGFILTSISILYLIYLLLAYFILGISLPPGWLSIIFIFILFSSLNFIGIGIIGEYIARIFEQVKDRPKFIVVEKNF